MIPTIETSTASQVKSFQEEKLRSLLHYLSVNSAFYQKHFQRNQIDVGKIRTLEDLLVVPPVTKNDLQKFNWDFLCVPRSSIADYTSTSGTLGKPVTIALTENDLKRLAHNEYLSFTCADGAPGDLYQLMLTLDRQFMAGVAYYEGIRKLGAGSVRIGPGLPALQLETIEKLKPTSLVAVPSFLVKLAEYAERSGISLHQASVEKIICIGENIRTPDFQLNTLGKKICAQWNAKIYSTYASTEMQTAFAECAHGKGGHQHPELIIVEILDDNNNPVLPGQPGDLTITTLGIEGMPLLRYKTGDVMVLHNEPCACGRTASRVSPVLGRRQQMMKVKGTTIYPQGVFEILHEAGISEYVVEVSLNELGTDQLKVLLASGSENEIAVRENLQKRFESFLRVVPELSFISSSEIEKIQLTGGRKPVRFIDRRG